MKILSSWVPLRLQRLIFLGCIWCRWWLNSIHLLVCVIKPMQHVYTSRGNVVNFCCCFFSPCFRWDDYGSITNILLNWIAIIEPTENFITSTKIFKHNKKMRRRRRRTKKSKRTLLQFSFYYYLAFVMKFCSIRVRLCLGFVCSWNAVLTAVCALCFFRCFPFFVHACMQIA